MSGLTGYIKEAITELTEKVTWPTWKELQESAVIVMVASLIIGTIVFGMDKLFSEGLSVFYHLFD